MFLHVTHLPPPQPISLSELEHRRQATINAQQHFEAKRASEERRRTSRRTYTGPRSAMLGRFGLTLVVASVAVLIWVALAAAPGVTSVLLQAGYMGSNLDADLLPQMLMEAVGSAGVIMNVASGAGTVGWVISIIAAATDRGRRQAIFGIVLGAIEPLVVAIVFMVAVWIAVAAS